MFESDIGRVGTCTTDADGFCIAGEETIGDHLVIVKYVDPETGKTVYTGRPKSPEDFVGTDGDGSGDLASKEFQVLKVIKRDESKQFGGGSKKVVTGSFLEIVCPEYAIWNDIATGYVYPFIITSDSDWSVDVCAQVPEGYAIVGVYDEVGNPISDASCTQTFVIGETRVVAFEIVEGGSPRPVLDVLLTVSHEGKVTQVDIDVPGARTHVEADMQGSSDEIDAPGAREEVEEPPAQPVQPPQTGSGDGGGGSVIVWSLVAAALVPIAILTGTLSAVSDDATLRA